MRKWFKYYLEFKNLKNKKIKKHHKFKEFEMAMGGYKENDFYKNKKFFIQGFVQGRFKEYDKFLKNNLKKKDIISIASGRCINELALKNNGFDIDCSDLGVPESYKKSKKLFENFKYMKFNILKDKLKKRYQTALALGLVYVFSQNELDKFFLRSNRLIKLKGNLIIDSSSSPDNFYTYFFDKYFLKYEIYLISFILKFFGKKNTVVSRHHGYKFTNFELIETAKKNGFELVLLSQKDYLSEILRSKIISKIYNKFNFLKYILIIFGFPMPYLRIFKFLKTKEI